MIQKKQEPAFWAGGTCEYCGGEIVEKRVTLHRRKQGKDLFIENVSAGVCARCDTRYFTANVLKTVEGRARGRNHARREILVPVETF